MRTMLMLPMLLLAGACEPCGQGTPSLTLGTGVDEFVSLDAVNHTLELVHGPQGGYHVILAVRAVGLHPSGLSTGRMFGTVNQVQLADNSIWTELTCDRPSDTQQTLNQFLIFDAQPEDLDGQQADVDVWLTDVDGVRVEDEATITIVDPLLE
jgi:hypothetical protein